MQLVLTILSGLVLWAFLTVLVVALGRIRASLAGINASLAKIAMGVRAIEGETAILKAELPATASTTVQIEQGVEVIAARLASAEARLAKVAH